MHHSTPNKDMKWQHPSEILKLQKLKLRKKALQERISGNVPGKVVLNKGNDRQSAFEDILSSKKRKNPFLKQESESKKARHADSILEESTDQTLFKLFNESASTINNTCTLSFSNILANINQSCIETGPDEIVLTTEKPWCPIDWTLKYKMRLISQKPFSWNNKLKISEEASGITSFTRCLDIESSETTLDASPNAKFHQCCLFWQQPFFPWLSLFPRNSLQNSSSGINFAANLAAKNSLYQTWTDSLRSLFQLLRTRQCPYFYVCANTFTALFRAAGILSYTDVHVIVTPTTRGFRNMLKQEDIEFLMPLKSKKSLEANSETEVGDETIDVDENKEIIMDDDTPDEEWLKTMGIHADDIKQINYTQARIQQKTECKVDSSEQSLILIEGVEVNAFFNFLINCKSAIAMTGPLAGVPPTLLAPVSFHGATLNALKVRENRIHADGTDFYSLELRGPILPTTIHNLFNINPPDHSLTASFSNVESTHPFSKIRRENLNKTDVEKQGTTVFGRENLSDCGLHKNILKLFCSANPEVVSSFECVKYSGDNKMFTWT